MRFLSKFLGRIRERYHPLWRLRQMRFYPLLVRCLDFTLVRKLDGVDFPVALQSLRDFSWIANSENLEPETKQFLVELTGKIHIRSFWDVGANIGWFSWRLRALCPEVELVLVEPDPLNAQLLKCTMERNHLQAVTLIESPVTDMPGNQRFVRDLVSGATGRLATVDFSEDPMNIQGTYARHNNETISIQCQTLDGMVESGLPGPDLLKIDVEGAEYLVVKGGEKLFSVGRPLAIIEICDCRTFAFFKDHNYQVWTIDASAQNFFVAPLERCDFSGLLSTYPKVDGAT